MTCTKVFLDCYFNQKELLLCGYSRLFNLQYEIPLDVVQTCYYFLPSYIVIPQILMSDSSDTDDSEEDHLCEDEINEREYMWKYELLEKYQFIKKLKFNYSFSSHQYQSKLLSEYNNKYYSLNSGTNVIIKKIKHIFDSEISANQTLKELQMYNILKYNPHIHTLYDVILPHNSFNKYFNSLTFIEEYVGNNLSQILKSNLFLQNIQIKYILYQILLAIKYIHNSNILLLNLKPSNVLIADDCSVKISNFKHAVAIHKNTTKLRKRNVNAFRKKRTLKRSKRNNVESKTNYKWYQAPELILNLETNKNTKTAVDIWSIGMIFAELLQMEEINKRLPHVRGPLFPKYYEGNYMYNMCNVMQRKCNELLAIFEVIGSPNINGIENEDIKKCLNVLPKFKFNKKKFKKKYFPRVDDDALDLLMKLLHTFPSKRI
eukprot:155722_1